MSTEQNAQKNLNPKKRGLGRGLNALFEDDESGFANTNTSVAEAEQTGGAEQQSSAQGGPKRLMIGVDQISPNPDQPRNDFQSEPHDNLSESVREHGVLQPILVRPNKSGYGEGKYQIIAGERRWRAAQEAQLHEVPVIVLDLDDEQTFQVAMIENLQRENLNPIDEALGYKKLVEEYDYAHEKLAKIVGKSRPHIANTIRLLNLPEDVQIAVTNGDISMGHARALLGAPNPSELLKTIIKKKLSVRQTEALVADESGRKQERRPRAQKDGGKDTDTLALERDLSDTLGMRVTINAKGQSGSLKVDFKDLDQLDDVIARLKGMATARLRA